MPDRRRRLIACSAMWRSTWLWLHQGSRAGERFSHAGGALSGAESSGWLRGGMWELQLFLYRAVT